jgi:hypothetical protein
VTISKPQNDLEKTKPTKSMTNKMNYCKDMRILGAIGIRVNSWTTPLASASPALHFTT